MKSCKKRFMECISVPLIGIPFFTDCDFEFEDSRDYKKVDVMEDKILGEISELNYAIKRAIEETLQ